MKKILVIEDENDLRENIVELLEENDFETCFAVNGVDGIDLAEKEFPDLILCDIMMPGIDGYRVKKSLQKNKKTSVIPFVFLTAKAKVDEIRKGMILGADDYIIKPYDSNQLIESINVRIIKHEEMVHSSNLDNNNDQLTGKKVRSKNKVLITVNNKQKLLDLKTIIYIKSNANYTDIYTTNNEKLLVRKLIGEWEELLSVNDFLRIHQSTIININYIEKIEKLAKRTYVVRLNKVEKPLTISARYSSIVKARFKF